MPIKLWSDEAQNFADVRTGDPVTADELVELVVAYRTLPADRQAVRQAYVEALLARRGGREPHYGLGGPPRPVPQQQKVTSR